MMVMIEEDFYLCQPAPVCGKVPSCASCCGIYNYTGHNRQMVSDVLSMQTELVEGWDGTDHDMERIREEAESKRPPQRFEVIYNCPFAGFLNPERTRVGCLLHPLYRGHDLREYCRYGRKTCNEAKCQAYTYLNEGEARAVMASAADWYIYGLSITDIDLVRDFFELSERKTCKPVAPANVEKSPELCRIFGEYLSWKEDWHLARDPGRFGKYYFQGRDYMVYTIDYHGLGFSDRSWNGILLSLGSVVETRQELEEAIEIIDNKVEEFVRVYEEDNFRGEDHPASAYNRG
ncbi:MAG: hypothetical protein R6V10_16970 [bacterium]